MLIFTYPAQEINCLNLITIEDGTVAPLLETYNLYHSSLLANLAMGLLKRPKNYRKAVRAFKNSNHTFTLYNMPHIRQKCDTNLKLWTKYRKASNKLHQAVATRLKKLLATH